jgi:FkbM family methyltransferase
MHFLLVAKQKKTVEAFAQTLRCLIDRGHSVTLAVQEHDEKRGQHLEATINDERFAVVPCPEVRSDEWADVATLLRRLRDAVHYLRPALRGAVKLRTRALDRLRQDLLFDGDLTALANTLLTIPAEQVGRIDAILGLAEQRLPPDPLFDGFLNTHQPDVLLLSPLVHFGPAQADLAASARRLGIPTWMLLYSWDNLSTKGALHVWPDRMFVWNDQQRREAQALHDFPPDRVVVVGAPRFDGFFALKPAMSREEFLSSLGLEPSAPTLLYVCSSRFVSESELPFVRRWVDAIRNSSSPRMRSSNLLVRPHPDIALLPPGSATERHRWPALPDLPARIGRPFDDPRALVLITPNDTPRGLFESIVHSDGVVGLNTTAEIEAGIVGRPVFTIVAEERDADGQSSTVHFHYLRKDTGGFVSTASSFDEHLAQLERAFEQPFDPAPIRGFIESFVRPRGFDTPVSPLYADALVTNAASPTAGRASTDVGLTDRVDVSPLRRTDRTVLALGSEPAAARVYETAIAKRRVVGGVIPLDERIVQWIDEHVGIGDVIYDVGSEIGEYAIVAVKRKGAIIIGFEPAYSAHKEFCDNILLNRCEAQIVPVPIAPAASDGIAEIKYLHGHPGEPGYVVRHDISWRVKHRGPNKPYLQPACLVRLDSFVDQQHPPSPNHLRIAIGAGAATVIAGAPRTVRASSLKSICAQLETSDEPRVNADLGAAGWIAASRITIDHGIHVIFQRQR